MSPYHPGFPLVYFEQTHLCPELGRGRVTGLPIARQYKLVSFPPRVQLPTQLRIQVVPYDTRSCTGCLQTNRALASFPSCLPPTLLRGHALHFCNYSDKLLSTRTRDAWSVSTRPLLPGTITGSKHVKPHPPTSWSIRRGSRTSTSSSLSAFFTGASLPCLHIDRPAQDAGPRYVQATVHSFVLQEVPRDACDWLQYT